MLTKLVLDEEGLRIALNYYLSAMQNKCESSVWRSPIDPNRITRVEIQPRVKAVTVYFEVTNGKPNQ